MSKTKCKYVRLKGGRYETNRAKKVYANSFI